MVIIYLSWQGLQLLPAPTDRYRPASSLQRSAISVRQLVVVDETQTLKYPDTKHLRRRTASPSQLTIGC